MNTIIEPVMHVEDLTKKVDLNLSGAQVEDGGHCKYCINGSNYNN